MKYLPEVFQANVRKHIYGKLQPVYEFPKAVGEINSLCLLPQREYLLFR